MFLLFFHIFSRIASNRSVDLCRSWMFTTPGTDRAGKQRSLQQGLLQPRSTMHTGHWGSCAQARILGSSTCLGGCPIPPIIGIDWNWICMTFCMVFFESCRIWGTPSWHPKLSSCWRPFCKKGIHKVFSSVPEFQTPFGLLLGCCR